MFNISNAQLQRKGRVAAFDVDGTIIATLGDKTNVCINSDIIRYLQYLSHDQQFDIVFFSNQLMNINRDAVVRFIDRLREFELHCWIYVSTKRDEFRKPEIGMMLAFARDYAVKITHCFYCGDQKCDKEFAHKLRVPYYHPAELLGNYCSSGVKQAIESAHIVILVGSPLSGKTTLCNKIKNEWYRDANNIRIIHHRAQHKDYHYDTTTMITEHFTKNKDDTKTKFIINGTNHLKTTRAIYLNIAKDYNLNIVILQLSTNIYEIKNRNARGSIRRTEKEFTRYFDELEIPSSDEGNIIVLPPFMTSA